MKYEINQKCPKARLLRKILTELGEKYPGEQFFWDFKISWFGLKYPGFLNKNFLNLQVLKILG